MNTGLSISEINDLVKKGAEISEDGIITLSNDTTIQKQEDYVDISTSNLKSDNESSFNIILLVGGVATVLMIGYILVRGNKKINIKKLEKDNKDKGEF